MKESAKASLKEWGEALIYALVLFVILYFVLFPVRISGPSMESTLYDGNRVAVSRVMAMLDRYERGDLITFNTRTRGEKEQFIKRVIGLPGDVVTLYDGVLTLNGEVLTEAYAVGYTEGEVDLVVPEDAVFVLGDNREHSTDSRHIGCIPKNEVQRKVVLKWLPLTEFNLY